MFKRHLALGFTIYRFRKLISIIALIFAAHTLTAAELGTNEELTSRAKKAFASGNRDEAIALASQAIKTEPKNPRGYLLRAGFHEERSEPAKALTDYDQVLGLDPRIAEAWQHRGIVHFKLAHIDESISDFDQFLKLAPAQAPYHWQRGISYYYAGRFELQSGTFMLFF